MKMIEVSIPQTPLITTPPTYTFEIWYNYNYTQNKDNLRL